MALFAQNICRRFLFTTSPILKSQKPKKNVLKKPSYFFTNACWPKTIDKLKTIDVPEHFKMPKLLKELSGYSFIPVKKLNLDGFKQTNSNKFYLEADKNGIEIAKDKELAKLIISKKWYHQIEDPKKRLVVTKVKCKIPELHKGTFDTHVITHRYEVEPDRSIDIIPDVEDGCIRTVEKYKAMKNTLKNFTKGGSRSHYFTRDTETGYTTKGATTKTEVPLGKIDIYEYTHLNEPDTKASIVKISATSKKLKKLSKLNDYVVGQFYSEKKQALTDINQVVQKVKSGVYDENMIVGKFTDILANERLEEPTEGPEIKLLRTPEGDFKAGNLKKGSTIDYLVFQKFEFQSKEDKDFKFLAWKIVETNDKTLKTFVGQALVQKIDQKQQALTKPDEVINYVLDNSSG